MDYTQMLFVLCLMLCYMKTRANSNPEGVVYGKLKNKLSNDVTDKINAFADALFGCSSLVSMNLVVVQDGAMVFSNGYGVKDLESSQQVTNDTLYSIGSITKSITSTLLGKVLKEKGLSWDDKVVDILSDEEFQLIDPLVTCQVTLKDLSAHRTGISDRNFAVFQDITRKQLVANMRFSPSLSQYRNGFVYNNNMYGVMAYIIEKLTGESFEELVRKEIFVPLQMNSSTFMHQMDLSDANLAQAYLEDPFNGNQRRPVSKELAKDAERVGAGAGMVVSTAEDMSQYLKLHMGLGIVDGRRILSADIVSETHGQYTNDPANGIFKVERPVFPVTHQIHSYGLGSFSGSYRGYKTITFIGNLFGYGSVGTYLQDLGIGVYAHGVASNELDWGIRRHLLFMYITDLLLGEELWLNEDTICTFPKPWMNGTASDFNIGLGPKTNLKKAKSDSETWKSKSGNSLRVNDMSPYFGQYGNFQYGNVTVDTSNTDVFSLSYGVGRWTLTQTGEHIFLAVPGNYTFPVYIPAVEFRKFNNNTGLWDEVLLSFYEMDRNSFQRNLRLSDAPSVVPINCEFACSGNGAPEVSTQMLSPVFMVLVTIIFSI